jgi:hypothetical protein
VWQTGLAINAIEADSYEFQALATAASQGIRMNSTTEMNAARDSVEEHGFSRAFAPSISCGLQPATSSPGLKPFLKEVLNARL